jgi:hypothetical protein
MQNDPFTEGHGAGNQKDEQALEKLARLLARCEIETTIFSS